MDVLTINSDLPSSKQDLSSDPEISKQDLAKISNLSKEELENLSWKFLDLITEQMDRIPEAKRNSISLGKALSASGLIYEHVIDKVRIKAQIMQEIRNKGAQKVARQ